MRTNGGEDGNGGYDGDVLDKLMYNKIEDFRKQIKDYYEGEGITLESYELDALIAVAYGSGYINNANIELLKRYKEEGKALKNEMIENFYVGRIHPFSYGGWDAQNRRINLIELFFEGRYILSTMEEIDPNAFIGIGGITTEAEAQALQEWFHTVAFGGSVTETFSGLSYINQRMDIYNALEDCWKSVSRCPGYSDNLQMFQCTWWVAGRATYYLNHQSMGSKYAGRTYPTPWPNGGEWYWSALEAGKFECGQEPRPNSIGSGASASSYGHVFYVEGVTDEGAWISECGSGSYWGGVQFWSNEVLESKTINGGYIYLDSEL